MKVVYIHGFQSSSNAKKAQILRKYLEHNESISFEAYDFPDDIGKSYEYLCQKVEESIERGEPLNLVGSSMGGFLSLLLSNRYRLKAALINPCLYPSRWVRENDIVGKTLENFDTHAKFTVTEDNVLRLKELESELRPYRKELLSVYLQSGDEVLDYRYALNFFSDLNVDVKDGGSHGYDNFENIVPQIIKFFSQSLIH